MSTAPSSQDVVMRATEGPNDWIELHREGMIITCSRTKSGRNLTQLMVWPQLLPWLCEQTNRRLDRVEIVNQPVSEPIARELQIPRLFVVFLNDRNKHPVVITREPLPTSVLVRIMNSLPPAVAVFNDGVAHVLCGAAAGLSTD